MSRTAVFAMLLLFIMSFAWATVLFVSLSFTTATIEANVYQMRVEMDGIEAALKNNR